jgi:lysophospholipase L1-like esterase
VGVPVADVLVRPNYRLNTDAIAVQKYYSYEFAKQNPAAFGHWWNHFVSEWRKLQRQICTLNNRGSAPWVLRPGSEGQMFQSVYRINKLGFRGPEFLFEKGDAYRIVALGESTTFGQTMNADDVPWPEVLERLIREELKPDRPVQVINAGVPSYTIRVNVLRLEKHILPLKPDMIISYHGYNGFMYLNPSLPPTHGKGPPPYKERPLKLLADSEYRFKMMAYRHSRVAPVTSTNIVPDDPMKTEYADAYRDLIQATHTNGIKLVLANYSMAVNAQSDADVVTFYRAGFPRVISEIDANRVHSQIVSNLAAGNPGIHLVDTHPGLDGQHEKFIDLVHFTQAGRKQIAETMFKSIKPILKQQMTTHESPTE